MNCFLKSSKLPAQKIKRKNITRKYWHFFKKFTTAYTNISKINKTLVDCTAEYIFLISFWGVCRHLNWEDQKVHVLHKSAQCKDVKTLCTKCMYTNHSVYICFCSSDYFHIQEILGFFFKSPKCQWWHLTKGSDRVTYTPEKNAVLRIDWVNPCLPAQ